MEPSRLAVTRHRIGTPESPDQTPLRVAALMDLHLKSIGKLEESVAERLSALSPDLILIVGDAVDRDDALPTLGDFLELLPPRVPMYAILGNWEHWSGVNLSELAATYYRFSGRLLVNDAVRISHGGRDAVLVGIDDLVGGAPDLGRARQKVSGGDPALLLSHCPGYRDSLGPRDRRRFVAMLSGHTHGGQVTIGGWAPLRPRGSGRYVAGWYLDEGPDLYVSRGIGTSIVPVRLGSVPELAYFEWFL